MKITAILAAAALSVNLSNSAFAAPASGQLFSSARSSILPNIPVPAPVPSSSEVAAHNLAGVFSFFDNGTEQSPLADEFNKSIKAAVYTLQLETVRNDYLKPENASFTTGRGTRVYVGLAKASNCTDGGTDCEGKDKAVIVITAVNGPTFLIRGMDIANWSIFMSGHRDVTIDGEKYRVKLHANATSPASSRIEVKGPGNRGLNITMQQLADGLVAKSQPVRLSRNYKLAYGNQVVQDGGRARFSNKTEIIMYPVPMTDDHEHHVIKTEAISPSGTRFGFEPSAVFAINGGVLEISR